MRRYVGPAVIVLVFAVLLLFVLLTQNNGSNSTNTPVAGVPSPTVNADLQILKLGANEAITGMEIKTVTNTLQIKLDAGQWKETAPANTALDGAVISDTVQQLSNLTGSSAIPADKAANLSTFGLDKPTLTVNLTTGSGTKTLLYGAFNPASSVYYVKLGSDAKVWTVSSFTYNTLISWVTQPPTPAPTISLTGGPQTPLPTVTPSPSPAPPTSAPAGSPGATPASSPGATTPPASTTTAATTTTAPSTTTAATTTTAPSTTTAATTP